MPPRVPSGRPSTCSSWVRSAGSRKVSPPGERPALPTASRLIFSAAEMYRSKSVGERSPDGHIVESVTGIVAGQKLIGVDVESQQVADRVLILGPIQPPQSRGSAGIGMVGGELIELGFERGQKRLVLAFVGPVGVGRWHLTNAKLAVNFFPLVAVRGDV